MIDNRCRIVATEHDPRSGDRPRGRSRYDPLAHRTLRRGPDQRSCTRRLPGDTRVSRNVDEQTPIPSVCPMTRWLRPLLGALLLTALVLPARVEAHIITPSVINQSFQIWFGDSYIRLNAFLDHGELHAPALLRRADAAGDNNGEASTAELVAIGAPLCEELMDAVDLRLDGDRLELTIAHAEVESYTEDEDRTLYGMYCETEAVMGERRIGIGSAIEIESRYLPSVPGIRDFQAVTDIEQVSRSVFFTSDPTAARFDFTVIPYVVTPPGDPSPSPAGGTPAPTPAPPLEELLPPLPAETPGDLGGGLLALVAAFLIGAAHAVTPGHGKALIAAALMGQRATPARALLIGLSVSAAHTVGVLVMAIVVSFLASASAIAAIARFTPLVAALVMVGVAGWMLRSALRGGHDHHHNHRAKGRTGHQHTGAATDGSLRALLLIGISGGIVPSASALIVLVGAITTGAAAWGVLVVLAFGLGMAAVMSLVAITAGRIGATMDRAHGLGHLIAHRLPIASATLVMVLALGLTVGALLAL